jgi:hypothetical protein
MSLLIKRFEHVTGRELERRNRVALFARTHDVVKLAKPVFARSWLLVTRWRVLRIVSEVAVVRYRAALPGDVTHMDEANTAA